MKPTVRRVFPLPLVATALLTLFVAPTPAAERPNLVDAARRVLASEPDLSVGAITGEPPVGIVSRNGDVVGWYGSSYDHLKSIGYSGLPIDILVVVGKDGKIMGADLLSQEEPVLKIGVGADELSSYVNGFKGADVLRQISILKREGSIPDAVTGATISSGVIRDAILRTGRVLVQAGGAAHQASVTPGAYPDWKALVESGRVSTMTVTFDEARHAMPGVATIPEGDGPFIDVAAAALDDRDLANNLIGAQRFDRFAPNFAADQRLLLIAGRGIYSLKGTDWRKSGVFERLAVGTGGKDVPLTSDDHVRLEKIQTEGAPDFREVFVVPVPAEAAIGPDAPFDLSVIVDKTGDGAKAPQRFTMAIGGKAPDAAAAALTEEPLWMQNWRDAAPRLAVLTVMLAILLGALYVSGPIVRRPTLYAWFRVSFLLTTLIWLGWIAGAQLSIVQVVVFLQSMLTGFRWDVFLLAPLIFVVWSFVALGILFWGRGVYCGWLCPFGALQELLHRTGQYFRLPRYEVPWEVHERLWPLKYIALLAVIGLSLQNPGLAFEAAEVEPFKTAITLHFLRDWPFVVYAVAILAAGLFVERAYCRYLCPLGAALAIPSKFKIFDWLIRRPQCGRECRVCATTCTVQAIDPIGRINPNECIYCLKCQVNYYDANTCVPLKMRARRHAGAPAAPASPD